MRAEQVDRSIAPHIARAYGGRMGRTPNEMPGRPVSSLVPTWSDNEDAATKAQRRRLAVEGRRRHPSWWRRVLHLRSVPPAD